MVGETTRNGKSCWTYTTNRSRRLTRWWRSATSALSAQLWTTCCWSKDDSGWKIGDFNYLVVSVAPDADTSLYVQFWSEPGERVLLEVGSGEWCPAG